MSINTVDYEFVRELIRRSAAIILDGDKQYLVESRLAPLVQREGFTSLGQLVTQLRGQADGDLTRKVIDAMTTNETMFFRDLHPFETLRKNVLPELINRRSALRRLNLWCAACSTGQEPYSIAMMLAEHFPSLESWNVTITATDLCTEVLERARAGRFSQLEINRGLPAPYLLKYFTRTGAEWQIREDIRRRVTFKPINLSKPWMDLMPMDVVFIRNVLIYFNLETKRDILGRIRRLIMPGGCLFVGSSESTLNIDDGFAPVMFERSVYFRVRDAAEMAAAGPRLSFIPQAHRG